MSNKSNPQIVDGLSASLSAFDVLKVNATDSDQVIRQSYLTLVRENPPEQNQKKFEEIRNAYEKINTQENRVKYMLFDAPMVGIASLIENVTKSCQKHSLPSKNLLQSILAEQMNERS